MSPEQVSGESPLQGPINLGNRSPNCPVTSHQWPWAEVAGAGPLPAVMGCATSQGLDISWSSGHLGREGHIPGEDGGKQRSASMGKVLPLFSFLSTPSIPSPARAGFHRQHWTQQDPSQAFPLSCRLFGAGAKQQDLTDLLPAQAPSFPLPTPGSPSAHALQPPAPPLVPITNQVTIALMSRQVHQEQDSFLMY